MLNTAKRDIFLDLKKIIKKCKDEDSFEIDIRYRFFIISYLFELRKIDSAGNFWMIIYNMDDKSIQSL